MDVKEQTRKAYELFGKGDMETFFNEMIDDNIVWTFPGKEGVHPLSGVHKGKQAMMAAMSKIPAIWPNFHLKILDMISEGNKVFVRVHATADNMDTMFGHYFESTDEGKTKIYENVEFQSNPEVGLLALFPKDGKESIMYSGLSFQIEMDEGSSKESYEMAQKAHSMSKEQMKMMLERETGPTDRFSSSFG